MTCWLIAPVDRNESENSQEWWCNYSFNSEDWLPNHKTPAFRMDFGLSPLERPPGAASILTLTIHGTLQSLFSPKKGAYACSAMVNTTEQDTRGLSVLFMCVLFQKWSHLLWNAYFKWCNISTNNLLGGAVNVFQNPPGIGVRGQARDLKHHLCLLSVN